MKFSKKQTLGLLVATVGFASAIIGLWDRFYILTPDNEVRLIKSEISDITITAETQLDTNYLKANTIFIDGVKLSIVKNGLIVANNIVMKNGGEIYGTDFYVVSTVIDGGIISSTGSKGMDGGNIFIASAQVNGTTISSNGLNGSKGSDGLGRQNGSSGSDGRDGNCDGFGHWRSAHPGGAGDDGADGTDGENGMNGGSGGNITILTPYNLSVEPESKGGLAGKGGKGGSAGNGGKGGRGGRGCAGLGGIQSTQSSGPDGNDGLSGEDGLGGINGIDKTPKIILVPFSLVKEVFQSDQLNKSIFIKKLNNLNSAK